MSEKFKLKMLFCFSVMILTTMNMIGVAIEKTPVDFVSKIPKYDAVDLRTSLINCATMEVLCKENELIVDLRGLIIGYNDTSDIDTNKDEINLAPMYPVHGDVYSIKADKSYFEIVDFLLQYNSGIVKAQQAHIVVLIITKDSTITGDWDELQEMQFELLSRSKASCGDVIYIYNQ